MTFKQTCILILLCLASPLLDAQEKPNVVFILADDMGYSDMSWQGSPIQTPNLDKLAREGMFLSRNYVQPQCTPTRIAFLTGNYPYRYGLHEHVLGSFSMNGIPAGEKTIAEKMKEGGYRTAIIGKWHAGGYTESYLPHNQGFDHSFVCIGGAISYWNYSGGNISSIIRNGEKYYAGSMVDGEESGNTYSTELWRNEAVDLIHNHDKKQPLFLYLPFNAPHYPLHAPKKVLDKYRDLEIDAYWSGPDASLGRNASNRRLYMAMVDAMDAAIGGVVKALESEDMLKNTLIVFCSDNGGIQEGDNRPLRSYKGDSFEGGVRVPGIASWQGKIDPGTSSAELVYVADWYATFAEIAGMNTSGEEKDGVSALNVLLGGVGSRDHVPIISAARHAYITPDFSLVGGGENYQRILNQDMSSFRLYELKEDLSQTHPSSHHPDLMASMKDSLKFHFKKTHRGYFNWDMMYSKYRTKKNSVDHELDLAIDDTPELKVVQSGEGIIASISPVHEELAYTLFSSQEGEAWKSEASYICREDAESYTFPEVIESGNGKNFKVQAAYHLGLPIHDSFSLQKAYGEGPLSEVPEMDGFLSLIDHTGGDGVQITGSSLDYLNWPGDGGALQMTFNNYTEEPSFTRYFVQPHARGKVYASMLVQFEGMEEECIGEINWLVQNGWNGATEKQVSLVLQQDGIYIDKADPSPPNTRKWLSEHHREVVCVLFEFDLGTIGADSLKVYINPSKGMELDDPHALLKGEFTFDRLQFKLTARTASFMTVDELHIGRSLEEVFPR
jgi:arylsulfatase A-like enzyme